MFKWLIDFVERESRAQLGKRISYLRHNVACYDREVRVLKAIIRSGKIRKKQKELIQYEIDMLGVQTGKCQGFGCFASNEEIVRNIQAKRKAAEDLVTLRKQLKKVSKK